MKNRTVSVTLLTLLLTGMLTLAFNVQLIRASGTIYIMADGSVYPPTAPILSVDNVTYTFIGNVNDSIKVERDNIVIDGLGYTLKGTGNGDGIVLYRRTNITVKNVRIIQFDTGIWLYHSSNNSISGNNITNNYDEGIRFDGSSNNSISGNNITNNVFGIWLDFSSNNNNISGNRIAANNDDGIYIIDSSNNSISGNNITNNYDGIRLYYSPNNVLRDNAMANNKYNFGVWGSKLSHFINDVDASNSVDGKLIVYLVNKQNFIVNPQTYPNIGYLAVINSTNIIVQHLKMENNLHGVSLVYTKNSLIQNVTVTSNLFGIQLGYSSSNNISGNNVTNNFDGIKLDESSINTISGNNITANKYYGIWFYWYSNNNSMSGNNIRANNYEGIRFYYSSNNSVYHNNFVSNAGQASTYKAVNVWDDGYPSGGNYWSDYEQKYPDAKEKDNSGIWDTPYVIDENNQDNYPLMEPWSPKPLSPVEATQELIETIETWNLSKGVEKCLTSKLSNVIHLLGKRNEKGATHKLIVVINQVEALRGNKLTTEQAEYIISEAQRIIDLIKG